MFGLKTHSLSWKLLTRDRSIDLRKLNHNNMIHFLEAYGPMFDKQFREVM